jgi:tRNA(Met) cytidine acetyltransferase
VGRQTLEDGEDTRAEIDSFVHGHRTLEATLPALSGLVRRRLGPALGTGTISLADGALLVAASRQLWPVDELVRLAGTTGRETLIERLRTLIRRIAYP